MNKAFVREPDEPDDVRCPDCGAIGRPVSRATLERQLPSDATVDLHHAAFYCPGRLCPVGYFDAFARTIPVELIRQPIHPKPIDAPICLCTGLTDEQITADAQAADPTRVRAVLERCRDHPEQCAARTPDEQTCEAQVQQLYLKHLNR